MILSMRKVLISIHLPKVMQSLHNSIVYYYNPIVGIVIAILVIFIKEVRDKDRSMLDSR